MRFDRKKLVCAMIDADINTVQLAEKTGFSRTTISGIKCGKSCTYETGQKIAAALDAKLDDLLEL